MKHDNSKSMMFYFLNRINYNQTWEQIEFDMGYDLGDFCFQKAGMHEKIKRLAKQNWIELQDYFNEEGN